MKNYILFLLLISLTNCDKYSSKENINTYEIINLLAKDSPSNHPFKSGKNQDFDITEYLIDNKFIVAVNPKMTPIEKSMSLSSKYKNEYQELLEKLRTINSEKSIKIEKIEIFDNVKFIELTEKHLENMKRKCEFEDFHLYLGFSRIAFNENYDKAILGVGNSASCLAGEYGLCLLKKENGKWKVIGFDNIIIS